MTLLPRVRISADIAPVLGVAAGCTLLAWLVRYTLNPDGVAYADLAIALRGNHPAQLVQAYWSPLLPALLALSPSASPHAMIVWAHAINLLAVLAVLVMSLAWSRRRLDPNFTRWAIAALLFCSTTPPRIEAVTPDLLVLALLAAFAWEFVEYGLRRWTRAGTILAAAFLARTSLWPWLLIALVILLFTSKSRRAATGAATLVLSCVAAWAIALHVRTGRPALDQTAALNYRWYLASSDSRSPDEHTGEHRAYRDTLVDGVGPIRVAWFDDDTRTYHPWSDPASWSRGLISHHHTSPSPAALFRYWLDALVTTVTRWLLPLLLLVILPVVWLGRTRAADSSRDRRGWIVVALGLVGVAQFIAVHAEPRLIAPFAMLGALGVIAARSPQLSRWNTIASTLALVLGIVSLIIRIRGASQDDLRIRAGLTELDAEIQQAWSAPQDTAPSSLYQLVSNPPDHPRSVVAGPAVPVMANLFWIGSHVVAQILPASAERLRHAPPATRDSVIAALFRARADLVWWTTAAGEFELQPISAPPGP